MIYKFYILITVIACLMIGFVIFAAGDFQNADLDLSDNILRFRILCSIILLVCLISLKILSKAWANEKNLKNEKIETK